jgi:two-component system response regulator LytT
MKALVVDDEPLVRSELVFALGRVAEDVLVTEAGDAATALAILAREIYDVLFLDIAMPGMNGLDALRVVNALPHRPRVVFVTAYEKHAVDAFEHAAADYLIKPVSEERLAITMSRLRELGPNARPQSAKRTAAAGRLGLELDGRTLLVKIDDVRYIHANGHVVLVRLFDRELRYRGSISELAARLESSGFLRVHRSYVVNPDHVVEITPFFGGTYVLRIDDKAQGEVPVSRSYVPNVKRELGIKPA